MQQRLLFTVILLFGFSLQVHANNIAACGNPVDIRSKLQDPGLQQLFAQSRHQGDTDWCYAFATADLVSLQMGTPISAIDLAVQYNSRLDGFGRFWRKIGKAIDHEPNDIPDGGLMSEALAMGMQSDFPGFCSESEVRSTVPGSFKKAAADLNLISRKRNPADREFSNLAVELGPYFPTLQPNDLRSEIENASRQRQDASGTLMALVSRACPQRLRLEPGAQVHNQQGNDDKVFAQINSQLDRNNAVGILYDSSTIHNNAAGADSMLDGYIPDHVSVVIGRRWNPDADGCQYLVRDSFGPSCDHLQPSSVTCACSPSDTTTCKPDGSYWITESKLASVLYSISYLM